MEIIETRLRCCLIAPVLIKDIRGWFQIPFNIDEVRQLGMEFRNVCQLNHSFTEYKGVVRGLNYQRRPYNQAKIIRVIKGSVYSVAVDIDPMSENYGMSCGFKLSSENKSLMYVPNTYAHGFVSLTDMTELEYFTDNIYSFEAAKSIRYDDSAYNNGLGIDWTMDGQVKLKENIRSNKNINAPDFRDCEF